MKKESAKVPEQQQNQQDESNKKLGAQSVPPAKKNATDDDKDGQQLEVQKESKKLSSEEILNKKLTEQQTTLNEINETLKKMSAPPPPPPPKKEEKKEEKKKDKKVKFWDDFFKDIFKTTLKFGGGFLAMFAIMGVFGAALAGILFTIGFICLTCTDPFFEIYDEKISPWLKKTYGDIKKYVGSVVEYHKQRKQFKAYEKNKAKQENEQIITENKPSENKDLVNTKPDGKLLQQEKLKEEKTEQPVENKKTPEKPVEIQQQNNPKQTKPDVQTKLFKKTELNPIFLKRNPNKDNVQSL